VNLHWLFRMSQWARNPPSRARVKFVFAIVLCALGIVFLEWMGWWPESLTAQRMRP
jgi:hypothetical protein